MSQSNNGMTVTVGSLFFWGFIGVKVMGHAFALWSWWWVLLPIIPWIGLLVQHAGL